MSHRSAPATRGEAGLTLSNPDDITEYWHQDMIKDHDRYEHVHVVVVHAANYIVHIAIKRATVPESTYRPFVTLHYL